MPREKYVLYKFSWLIKALCEDVIRCEDVIGGEDVVRGEEAIRGEDAIKGEDVIRREDAIKGEEAIRGDDEAGCREDDYPWQFTSGARSGASPSRIEDFRGVRHCLR